MPFLTVAGARAHFVQRRPVPAAGPPVVFLHGAGGSHQHWLYQVRDVGGSVTYALDLPGHGRSEGSGRASIAAYGDWVVAFLDAADLEKAVLVGHSMGGGIALDLALRVPSRLAGLGLVATGAKLRVAPAILEGLRQDPETAVRLISEWAFGPETPEEMARLGRRQMQALAPEVIYGDFMACDTYDVMQQVSQIAVPAVIVCGTQDYMTPAKYSVYLRDHLQGATLQLVEGAGHMVMVERPGAVVQALTSFLDSLS